VLAALDIIQSEPERIQKLWDNTRRMAQGFRDMGYDLGASTTPILPVIVGEDVKCLRMCCSLQEGGIFVNPVLSPAVEVGHALLRVSLMATHSFELHDHP
jgi:8-amino-7-oxononanoate synthase